MINRLRTVAPSASHGARQSHYTTVFSMLMHSPASLFAVYCLRSNILALYGRQGVSNHAGSQMPGGEAFRFVRDAASGDSSSHALTTTMVTSVQRGKQARLQCSLPEQSSLESFAIYDSHGSLCINVINPDGLPSSFNFPPNHSKLFDATEELAARGVNLLPDCEQSWRAKAANMEFLAAANYQMQCLLHTPAKWLVVYLAAETAMNVNVATWWDAVVCAIGSSLINTSETAIPGSLHERCLEFCKLVNDPRQLWVREPASASHTSVKLVDLITPPELLHDALRSVPLSDDMFIFVDNRFLATLARRTDRSDVCFTYQGFRTATAADLAPQGLRVMFERLFVKLALHYYEAENQESSALFPFAWNPNPVRIGDLQELLHMAPRQPIDLIDWMGHLGPVRKQLTCLLHAARGHDETPDKRPAYPTNPSDLKALQNAWVERLQDLTVGANTEVTHTKQLNWASLYPDEKPFRTLMVTPIVALPTCDNPYMMLPQRPIASTKRVALSTACDLYHHLAVLEAAVYCQEQESVEAAVALESAIEQSHLWRARREHPSWSSSQHSVGCFGKAGLDDNRPVAAAGQRLQNRLCTFRVPYASDEDLRLARHTSLGGQHEALNEARKICHGGMRLLPRALLDGDVRKYMPYFDNDTALNQAVEVTKHACDTYLNDAVVSRRSLILPLAPVHSRTQELTIDAEFVAISSVQLDKIRQTHLYNLLMAAHTHHGLRGCLFPVPNSQYFRHCAPTRDETQDLATVGELEREAERPGALRMLQGGVFPHSTVSNIDARGLLAVADYVFTQCTSKGWLARMADSGVVPSLKRLRKRNREPKNAFKLQTGPMRKSTVILDKVATGPGGGHMGTSPEDLLAEDRAAEGGYSRVVFEREDVSGRSGGSDDEDDEDDEDENVTSAPLSRAQGRAEEDEDEEVLGFYDD